VGERRRLHNEELRNLCASTSIVKIIKSRRMRWAGYLARMGRWENNIEMDLREIGW
jgi:hypothetical protein